MTIRDIASEIAYSSGVLAHYFEDRDDLLAHALRLFRQQALRRYEAEIQAPVPADARKAVKAGAAGFARHFGNFR